MFSKCVCVFSYAFVRLCAHVYVCVFAYAFVHLCAHVFVCVVVCVCVCVCSLQALWYLCVLDVGRKTRG